MTKVLVNTNTNKVLANNNGTKVYSAPLTDPIIIPKKNTNGKLTRLTGIYTLPSEINEFGQTYVMWYAFARSLYTSANLSSLVKVSGASGFGFGFSYCTNLTTVDLSNLTTCSSNSLLSCFSNCTALTSVDLSSLNSIKGSYVLQNCFQNCTSLTTLSFPALNSTSFGSYTNQFYKMLSGVTGCTVHFPSNLQSVIGSWSDVTGGFGGTNTTVLFDLPATN